MQLSSLAFELVLLNVPVYVMNIGSDKKRRALFQGFYATPKMYVLKLKEGVLKDHNNAYHA